MAQKRSQRWLCSGIKKGISDCFQPSFAQQLCKKLGCTSSRRPKAQQSEFLGAKSLAAPVSGCQKFGSTKFWAAKGLAVTTFGGQKLGSADFCGLKVCQRQFLGARKEVCKK
jgi:hypothetical protein